jgi:hypothetical protein
MFVIIFTYLVQDFAKFDSSRSEVQDTDELNHFDLYLVHWKSLMGFLQNPQLITILFSIALTGSLKQAPGKSNFYKVSEFSP